MNSILSAWISALYNHSSYNSEWLKAGQTGQFCPLGLLCDVSNLGTWTQVYKPTMINLELTDPYYPLTYVTDSDDVNTETLYGTSILPSRVREAVQFSTAVGTFLVKELSTPVQTLLTSKLKNTPEYMSITNIASICTAKEIPLVIESILRTNPPSLYTPFPQPDDSAKATNTKRTKA